MGLRSSAWWRLGALLGVPLLTVPLLGSAPPPPDFTGNLRAGLPVSAWFDAKRERGFFRVGEFTSKVYRAYKVELGDLDGDGTRELLVGVWSNVQRHDEPNPHKTVWVLRWNDEERTLVEAWRGSALARPLVDFTVHDDRLVATERVHTRCFLTTYNWTGFGFTAKRSKPISCGES